MKYLWVQYLATRPVKIEVADCEDVDGLIRLVKTELGSLKDTPLENITIHTKETASPLRPGLPLSDISKQDSYTTNDDEHPLVVKAPSSLTGKIPVNFFFYC